MILVSILILLTVNLDLLAKDNNEKWWEKSHWEDAQNKYYVGVSEGHDQLQEAMNESYNEAIKEAVKHNYSFNHTYVQNFYSSIEKQELNEEFNLKIDEIRLEGITPVKQKVVEKNNRYLVYRAIAYSKQNILKEQTRLKSLKLKNSIYNEYDSKLSQSKLKGELVIETSPSNALVTLTSLDTKFQIKGNSNAKFIVPFGRYKAFIKLEGYNFYEEEIIIAGKSSKFYKKLEIEFGQIELDVFPKNAQILINNRPVKRKKIKLSTNENYKIKVSHEDYLEQVHEFQVSANQNEELAIHLRAKPSYISILSRPSGAQVYLDGSYFGVTPIENKSILAGARKIKIEKDGYQNVEKSIDVLANKILSPESFNLKKKKNYKQSTEYSYTNSYFSGHSPTHITKYRFAFTQNTQRVKENTTSNLFSFEVSDFKKYSVQFEIGETYSTNEKDEFFFQRKMLAKYKSNLIFTTNFSFSFGAGLYGILNKYASKKDKKEDLWSYEKEHQGIICSSDFKLNLFHLPSGNIVGLQFDTNLYFMDFNHTENYIGLFLEFD